MRSQESDQPAYDEAAPGKGQLEQALTAGSLEMHLYPYNDQSADVAIDQSIEVVPCQPLQLLAHRNNQ